MKPYHTQTVQELSDPDKFSRVLAAQRLLEIMEANPSALFLFSDEATFHVSGKMNKRNCVTWATENPHELISHIRDSPKVNVWCAVSRLGVIGPYFSTVKQ